MGVGEASEWKVCQKGRHVNPLTGILSRRIWGHLKIQLHASGLLRCGPGLARTLGGFSTWPIEVWPSSFALRPSTLIETLSRLGGLCSWARTPPATGP